jgi:2-polyprenyl-3-methyl-5-hydroxy-6-metoxy-1,4-benzoquinol methylase
MPNTFDYNKYQQDAVNTFQELLSSFPQGTFDENGLPAYTNPNPLMRWIFWQRVKAVMEFIDSQRPINTCLDFGCGLGVMLPFLQQCSPNVLAHDLNTTLVQQICQKKGLNDIRFSTDISELQMYQGKVDAIIAMDVLEHVDQLEPVIEFLKQLLAPTGYIIVTGPTENYLYKLGRALARYSGHYHVRNIYDINSALKSKFQVKTVKTLYPVAPLFVISCAVHPV